MENSSYTFNSRRFLLGLGLFILFIVFFWVLTDMLMERVNYNNILGRSMTSQDNKNIYRNHDILFMGDSRTHQGIDPIVFDKYYEDMTGIQVKSYNMARPAMQAPFFYMILRDYLENNEKKPRAIVVNLSFYLLGGQEGYLRDIYLSNYKPKVWQVIDTVKSGLLTKTEAFTWYFKTRIPFLRHQKDVQKKRELLFKNPESLLTDINYNIDFWGKTFDSRNSGYFSRASALVSSEKIKFSYHKTYESQLYLSYIGRFFRLASEYRIPIIVYGFPWPNHQQLNHDVFNDIVIHYENILKEQAVRNPYVKFPEHDLFWPVEYFSDQQHLNQKGAQRLSVMVADWVSQLDGRETLPLKPVSYVENTDGLMYVDDKSEKWGTWESIRSSTGTLNRLQRNLGFSFPAEESVVVKSVKLRVSSVQKGGAATYVAKLYADNKGQPDLDELIATTESQLISKKGVIEYIFNDSIALEKNMKYWLILETNNENPSINFETTYFHPDYGSGYSDEALNIFKNLPRQNQWRVLIEFEKANNAEA